MKTQFAIASFLVTGAAFAANFGGSAATTTTAPAAGTGAAGAANVVVTAPVASGPQAAVLFRVFKTNGSTMIQQGNMGVAAASADLITVSESDALSKGVGKCAFNVKYDEVSDTPAAGTVNRLFSNDKVIAINSQISLVPNVVKTIWTQPYLYSGMNNVRLVINADSTAPSTKWIRINVLGSCGGTSTVAATTTTSTARPVTTTTATITTTTVAVRLGPGSSEWNNLFNAYGYSNYAVTQLKNKNYVRYAELVKLNSYLVAVVNTKSVDRAAYNALMTTWNTFVTDTTFRSMMAATVPSSTRK